MPSGNGCGRSVNSSMMQSGSCGADHSLFGNACPGQAQHASAAEAGKLNDQCDAGFRRGDGASGKDVELLGADAVIGDGKNRLLRLVHQRRAGMKAQILSHQIVTQSAGEPDRCFMIGKGQQQAGGGHVQWLPAVLKLLQGRQSPPARSSLSAGDENCVGHPAQPG